MFVFSFQAAGTRTPKPLEISCVICISFVIHNKLLLPILEFMLTRLLLEGPYNSFKKRSGPVIRRLKLSAPPHILWRGEENRDGVQSCGYDLVNHA